MNAACPACGLRFEREAGYFTGAMYVSYVLALPVMAVCVAVVYLVAPSLSFEATIARRRRCSFCPSFRRSSATRAFSGSTSTRPSTRLKRRARRGLPLVSAARSASAPRRGAPWRARVRVRDSLASTGRPRAAPTVRCVFRPPMDAPSCECGAVGGAVTAARCRFLVHRPPRSRLRCMAPDGTALALLRTGPDSIERWRTEHGASRWCVGRPRFVRPNRGARRRGSRCCASPDADPLGVADAAAQSGARRLQPVPARVPRRSVPVLSHAAGEAPRLRRPPVRRHLLPDALRRHRRRARRPALLRRSSAGRHLPAPAAVSRSEPGVHRRRS